MVFGAKLRTVMSSIIRWRNGVTLRAVAMENPYGSVLLLMASNDNENLPGKIASECSPVLIRNACEKKLVPTDSRTAG